MPTYYSYAHQMKSNCVKQSISSIFSDKDLKNSQIYVFFCFTFPGILLSIIFVKVSNSSDFHAYKVADKYQQAIYVKLLAAYTNVVGITI